MSQEQVRMNLGTPATTAVVGTGQAYYYISSTQTQTAFFLPTEKDRQVVAVYFTPGGTVERVANYGLQGRQGVRLTSRAPRRRPGGNDDGILKQLFRNLGQQADLRRVTAPASRCESANVSARARRSACGRLVAAPSAARPAPPAAAARRCW